MKTLLHRFAPRHFFPMLALLATSTSLFAANGTSATGSALITLPTDVAWASLPPHPRLFANAARFAALKNQTDPVSRDLRALLQFQAERALRAEPIVFAPPGRILEAMREAQERILALALNYRLTSDRRAFDRAREELLRLAALPEWHPAHFLDVGEAALAAGIGLDWLYDDLSPEDRDRIAQAIVKNALRADLAVPDQEGSWVRGDFNWAQVCHGGVAVAALAIAEREPALARQLVERAVSHLDKVGATYAPDGSYAEGPSYWSYGTTYHVMLIAALRTALGTSGGLETFPGFLKTHEYRIQMTAPTGEDFNYSDYHGGENYIEPIMLWFARELQDRSVARGELAHIHELALDTAKTPEPKILISRHLPLELLWWDPALPAAAEARQLHWTAGGELPLAVLRSAWDDPNASFLAMKGGTPNHSHAHMDAGSFILEAEGVRWALDLGTEDYDKMRAAGIDLWNYSQNSSRWTTFRVGPEGHNILRFDSASQNIQGRAEIRALPDDHGTMGDVADLTPLYAGQVARVQRTIELHPDGTMSIEDAWTAADHPVSATWQWLTKAQVTRTNDGLLLEQAGKKLALKVQLPDQAKIEVQDVSTPRAAQDSANPGLSRILITVPTTAQATVKLLVQIIPSNPDPVVKK